MVRCARGGGLVARAIGQAPAGVLEELGVLGGVVLAGVAPWDGDDLLWIEALHRRSVAAGGAGVVLRLPRFVGGDGSAGGVLAGAAGPLADVLERRWATLEDAPDIAWREVRSGRVIAVRGARTRDSEARAVARAVLDAVGAGISPERVAVVVPRTADDAAEAICAALVEARVPFAEPRGRSIAACPDGRAALALLALAEGPFTRDGLLEVLRAPGLHAGVWVEAADEGEAAVRAVRLASRLRDVPVDVDGSGRLFVDGLGQLVEDAPDDAWMPRAMATLVKSVRWVAEGGTLREGLRRFATLLDRAKLGQPSAVDLAAALGDEKRGLGALSMSALGENASAVRRLREVVGELGRAAEAMGLGGAPLSAAELRALLTGLCERTGARSGGTAARAGAVRVGRPEELAGLPFDRVVVTGLIESAYGDEDEEEELLAGGAESGGVDGVRDGIEGRARFRAPRRTLALAGVLASAPEVVLTYATGDEDERAKPHALVVEAIARMPEVVARIPEAPARLVEVSARMQEVLASMPELIEPASRVASRASVLGPRGAELVALAGGRPPLAELGERVRIERERYAFFMDPRTPAGDFTGSVRLVGGLAERMPLLVGGASAGASIAVTSIERAVGCAFAGFARRVVRISRQEDAQEAGDARERGTLVHRALSAAFEAARRFEEGEFRGAGSAAVPGGGDCENGGGGVNPDPSDRRAGALPPVEGGGARGWEPEAPSARPASLGGAPEVLRTLAPPPANQQTTSAEGAGGAYGRRLAKRRAMFAAARAAAEAVLGLDRVVSPLRREAIASAVRDALSALARGWDDDDPLRFHLGEQLFGRAAPPPWGALVLAPDEEEGEAPLVFVDGQIDRIDRSADGRRVRVIDYKTGRLPEGDGRKTALQLPLYGAVAARALGAVEVEAMYVRINARGGVEEQPKRPAERVVKAEDQRERVREARRAVLALWEGRVAPRPAFLSLCASCDARDLCRRPAVMPIEEMEERT
ncbi:MAG: PD-(D/E)XK nuclease family protein [Polyangiaceae bacterium]